MKRHILMIFFLVVIFLFPSSCSCSKKKKPTSPSSDSVTEKMIYCEQLYSLECFVNESISKERFIIWVVYSDDTKENVTYSSDTLYDLDTETEGRKTCTVTYHKLTTTFKVTVVKPTPSGVMIIPNEGTKEYYNVGDTFDINAYYANVYYNNNTYKRISAPQWHITTPTNTNQNVYDSFTSVGDYLLVLTYVEGGETYTATHTIYVVGENMTKLTFDALVSKLGSDRNYINSEYGKLKLVDESNVTIDVSSSSEFRLAIESRDDEGSLNLICDEDTYTSRLRIDSNQVGCSMVITVKERMTFTMLFNSTIETTPKLMDSSGTIYEFQRIEKIDTLTDIAITLNPGEYVLQTNVVLMIYAIFYTK